MSTTGAVNDQAASQPIGGGVRARSGTVAAHHGSGAPTGRTSVPARIRTPVSGSADRPTSSAYDVADQALTRPSGRAS